MKTINELFYSLPPNLPRSVQEAKGINQEVVTLPPKFICVDFETDIPKTDLGGLAVWHPDFKIVSASFSWRVNDNNFTVTPRYQDFYSESFEAIETFLKRVHKNKIPLIAHNLQFEMAIIKKFFPKFNIRLLKWDTQRMVKFADGGLGNIQKPSPADFKKHREKGNKWPLKFVRKNEGLSLQACCVRWLNIRPFKNTNKDKTPYFDFHFRPKRYKPHKETYYKYLRERFQIKRGKEGQHLHMLPPDMLRGYNVADTRNTLYLFERLLIFREISIPLMQDRIKPFFVIDFDYDMACHFKACDRLTSAYLEGVLVDQDRLDTAIKKFTVLKKRFEKKFISSIGSAGQRFLSDKVKYYISDLKTEKGRLGRLNKIKTEGTKESKILEFNLNSKQDLQELFQFYLNLKPTFYTDKGSWSFKRHHLKTYGELGKTLYDRSLLLKVLNDSLTLKKLSNFDGRWHLNLNMNGVKTGRYSGSSDFEKNKLNVQALPRRNSDFMTCLVAEQGYKFSSIDLVQGEPTVATQFSRDENYKLLNFDMVGKKPYFSPIKGFLVIDDIYLAGGSIHPTGRKTIQEITNTTYKGLSFYDAWLVEELRESIKDSIKEERAGWKENILAMGYGQKARGMVESAENKGYKLTIEQAETFYNNYWGILFPDIARFKDYLQKYVERFGCLVNPYGHLIYPEKPKDAFNYFCQSTVSDIIKHLENIYFSICDKSTCVTVIHDETIIKFLEEDENHCKNKMAIATKILNKKLDWDIAQIRTGFKAGHNLYEAK